MPLTKLTLSADPDLIEQAKKLAAAKGTSVSALFSRLLRTMTCSSAVREVMGPLTRKATGMVRLRGAAGDERLLVDALARKYAGRK
jgi:hypothetical protein